MYEKSELKKQKIQNTSKYAEAQLLLKIIIRQPIQMTQKSLLINSMEKLINHVRKSQANQQEIFGSLSRADFKKILSNLQDENLMLRKASLNLIAELLCTNSKLKMKFCHTMQITLLPGKILFHSKNIEKHVNSTNFHNIFMLLKKQPDSSNSFVKSVQSDCLLWYIHTNNPTRQYEVQFIQNDKNKQKMQIDIDPQECIVGFCLSKADLTNLSTTNLSIATDAQLNARRQQLKKLREPNPKKVISIVGQKINSSMTECEPRYQRNIKNTTQIETDRPKKFMNNFLHQRKLNTSKGAETERINTQRSQISVSLTSNEAPSFQVSKQITRSTMPKTTQSPYIPSLNLQNTSNINIGYRTDRVGESFTTTNNVNRLKEMDFHKIKYQGIKITATNNPSTRSSYGNNIPRNNTDRDHPAYYNTLTNGFTPSNSYMMNNSVGMNSTGININRRQAQNSFNFKYIKPMTTSNQEAIKFVNFFPKKPEDQTPLMEKKTIDVFQFIKNK